MLAVTALFVAALGFVKFKQIQTAVAQGAAFQPPPEAVTTIVVGSEEWPTTVSAIGTMAAVQGVAVSADLLGTVERIAFDSGTSVREGQVLALLARGLQTKQVAKALGISVKTADRHVQNIYAKIGVSSRAAATMFAMEHGLLTWGEFPMGDASGRS